MKPRAYPTPAQPSYDAAQEIRAFDAHDFKDAAPTVDTPPANDPVEHEYSPGLLAKRGRRWRRLRARR